MPLRPIPRPKSPRVGRPAGRFTQNRRIDFLREKLETHTAGLTLDEIAQMLRITTRSVRRYLKELSLIREVESVAVRPGAAHLWRIKPSERGRSVALRRTQAYALLATRRIFEVLRGSALFDEIDLVFREVEAVAHRPTLRAAVRGEASTDARLEHRFAYLPPLARGYADRTEDVDELFRALAELRIVRFRLRETPTVEALRDAKEPRGARTVAHPYALLLQGGFVVCLAYDVARGTTRVFPFERMSEIEASESERYELPEDFAIADWLQGDFGVASAQRTLRLLVEFDPRVAESVRVRRVHPSQKLALAPDGRVRVSLAVPDSVEVMDRVRSWILGFGASVRVLEPRELAEAIADELRRAAGRYPT